MKRQELLNRMQINLPEQAKIRLIVCSDAKNVVSNAVAILHYLLTPSFDVCGIIATNSERIISDAGSTMEQSYQELLQIINAARVDDIPVLCGCTMPLDDIGSAPDSEGVRLIISEASREDQRPLYIAVQGALTDVTAAVNSCPGISEKMTVVWIGGGIYPEGGNEFNLMQDLSAAQAMFSGKVPLWQIPFDAYITMGVTFAELACRVRPWGTAGRYLFSRMEQYNMETYHPHNRLHQGENWCLGDQCIIGTLLQREVEGTYSVYPAPIINDDMTYTQNPKGRAIRVYQNIDTRMALEDFYAKLQLCYG